MNKASYLRAQHNVKRAEEILVDEKSNENKEQWRKKYNEDVSGTNQLLEKIKRKKRALHSNSSFVNDKSPKSLVDYRSKLNRSVNRSR